MKLSNPGNGVVAMEKGAFGSPSTKVANLTYTSKLCQWYIKSKEDQHIRQLMF